MRNGVFIQNTTLFGDTGWDGPHAATDYKKHADKLPIQLQPRQPGAVPHHMDQALED